MKIKTIIATSTEDFDTKVNDFEKEHEVKFTQTQHTETIVEGVGHRLYRATIFYNE